MANEKIDVKAEAKGITWMSREDAERGIIDLCDRVRDEATRETVEKCIAIVRQQFAAGRRPEIERVLRTAFAEPGNLQGFLTSSPDALRQFVDAAVRLADAHMEYPASGHPDDMADTETILRLAPQFREQAP